MFKWLKWGGTHPCEFKINNKIPTSSPIKRKKKKKSRDKSVQSKKVENVSYFSVSLTPSSLSLGNCMQIDDSSHWEAFCKADPKNIMF